MARLTESLWQLERDHRRFSERTLHAFHDAGERYPDYMLGSEKKGGQGIRGGFTRNLSLSDRLRDSGTP